MKITKKSKKYRDDVKDIQEVKILEVAIMCRLTDKNVSYDEKIEFNKKIPYFNHKYDKHIVAGFVGTYGDEFQGIVNCFEDAFDILLDIKQELQNFKCRLVMGGVHIITRSYIKKENSWNILGYGLPGTRYLLNMNNKPFDIFIPKYESEEIEYLFEKMNFNDRKNIYDLQLIGEIKEKLLNIDNDNDLSSLKSLSLGLSI